MYHEYSLVFYNVGKKSLLNCQVFIKHEDGFSLSKAVFRGEMEKILCVDVKY